MTDYQWLPCKDGDNRARYLFDTHYSRYHYADGRKPVLFVGPGQKMVLLTVDCLALWAWRKFRSLDNQIGINCAIFVNRGPILSSELINEACQLAWTRWPGERLYTYVNPHAIKSINPGFCFKVAGFKTCGITKVNKLLILERLP